MRAKKVAGTTFPQSTSLEGKRTSEGFEAYSADPLPFLLMGLNVHSNLLRLIRDIGKWEGGWVPMSCHLLATLSPPE